jgi:hypothetical protein
VQVSDHVTDDAAIGSTTEHVTVAEPARRAAWAGEANGVRSCHQWSFTPPPGGTHVSDTKVFAGCQSHCSARWSPARWNRAFPAAAGGPIRRAAAADISGFLATSPERTKS